MIQPPPELRPILRHLWNYKLFVLAAIAVSTTPAIAQLVLSIGPPWPDKARAISFSVISFWIVMVVTHGLWHQVPQIRLRRLIVRFMFATLLFFVGFATLMAFFAENAPTHENQIARGFFMREEWARLLQNPRLADGTQIPVKTVTELLKANAWDPKAIYPAWTVNLVQVAIFGSWVGVCASLAALTSVYLLLQEVRADKRKLLA